ncbi:MAG: phosphatase [Clostridium sp.]
MKVLIDLHTHTISSGHAYSTVKENIDGAKENGLMILGLSDHGPAMPAGAHQFYFNNLRVIKDEINGVRVLKGVEANIINLDGDLDLEENTLNQLDYVIASLHPPCIEFASKEEVTNCIIEVMKKSYVKIVGHPDDSRYPLDYEKIAKVAKENNVLLELNNSSLKPNGFRVGAVENTKKMLEACEKHGTCIIMGSDSHMYYDIGIFNNCERIIEETNFPIELILNYDINKIREFFNI